MKLVQKEMFWPQSRVTNNRDHLLRIKEYCTGRYMYLPVLYTLQTADSVLSIKYYLTLRVM